MKNNHQETRSYMKTLQSLEDGRRRLELASKYATTGLKIQMGQVQARYDHFLRLTEVYQVAKRTYIKTNDKKYYDHAKYFKGELDKAEAEIKDYQSRI